MRAAWLACIVVATFAVAPARAEIGRVVLLQPSAEIDTWPAATRAVIAELVLSGYEITVQPQSERSLAELQQLLAQKSAEPGVVGAVLVVRSGARALATVWLSGSDAPALLSEPLSQDAVGPNALALKVTDLFRTRTLRVAEQREQQRRTPQPEQPADTATPGTHSWATLWLGQGATWSPETSSLSPVLVGGAQIPWFELFALDVSGALSLSPLNVSSEAGAAELGIAAAGVHALFDPWHGRTLSVAAGAGAALLWLTASGSGGAGFEGVDDTTRVWLVSTRARAAFKHGSFGIQLLLEPGLTLPAIRITADGRELNRLGRPWLQAMLGVSWDL
jgi:hypothetical protein